MKKKNNRSHYLQKSLIFNLAFFISTIFLSPAFESIAQADSGDLEIHYINVGQGNSTLIIGPNGTKILYDFGWLTGNEAIVPYLLTTVGLDPEDSLHYSIVSHRDSDHYTGYRDLIEAGFDITVANYGAGSPKKVTSKMRTQWLNPAKQTTAGAVRPIPVGLRISLGNGAEAVVVAANGKIIGRKKKIHVSNENDRSVGLFIHYGKFHYILDGDLGSGPEACTNHETSQKKIEVPVAKALIKLGLMDKNFGVDVMHIANHGSESSTSAAYYNIMQPQIGIISVGPNQGDFKHPRHYVVDSVLLGLDRPSCVTAPALELLLQTDNGIEEDCDHCGKNSGLSIGDIKISTDGSTDYCIQSSNCMIEGQSEIIKGHGWICNFDEDGPFSTIPVQKHCSEVVFEESQRMVSRCDAN